MAAPSETATTDQDNPAEHETVATVATVDLPEFERQPHPAPPLPTNPVWDGAQRLAGLVGLILSLPLLVVAFFLVKSTSRGPFLFAQIRRGYGGRPFCVYKVRTLFENAEPGTALGVAPGDPAVTPVGRVLRKLKVDELPQFWNIAAGDMNFVGPRPTPIALEDELARHIPNFRERHRVKPGLSSFGQVTIVENRLGADLVRDWSERFEADLDYIRNKSVAYDLVVIALTGLYLVRATLRPLLRMRKNRR